MAKSKNRITINVSDAQLKDMLFDRGLLDPVSNGLNGDAIRQLYDKIVEMENTTYPVLYMPAVNKKARKPFFKNFEDFKNNFTNFVYRLVIEEFLEECFRKVSSNHHCPEKAASAIILKRVDAIIEMAIQIAYAELSNSIHIERIQSGYKPFDL